MGMLIIYPVRVCAHACMCVHVCEFRKTGLVPTNPGRGCLGKMLHKVPRGETGESVALRMGHVGETLLILSILNPQPPKTLGFSL